MRSDANSNLSLPENKSADCFRKRPAHQLHWRSASTLNIAGAIRSGLGCAPLPCVLGELDPGLQLCFPFDEADFALLLITREEMRNLPHVRAFNDFIASRTSALRHMIEGRSENR